MLQGPEACTLSMEERRACTLMKLHMQRHRMHVDIQRNVSMVTKEHEYIPEDATDESHNAVVIGNPTNRTVHLVVAIVRATDSHTSLEFAHVTMSQRAAGECKLVKKKLLQSIGQPFVRKH